MSLFSLWKTVHVSWPLILGYLSITMPSNSIKPCWSHLLKLVKDQNFNLRFVESTVYHWNRCSKDTHLINFERRLTTLLLKRKYTKKAWPTARILTRREAAGPERNKLLQSANLGCSISKDFPVFIRYMKRL